MNKKAKIILGVVGGVVLVVGGTVATMKIIKNSNPDKKYEESYESLSDEEKRESEDAKHEYEQRKEDKNPEDIVINPEDSQEIVEEKTEEKTYWIINNKLKEIFNDSHTPISSESDDATEAVSVQNIFFSDNQLFVLYNVTSRFGIRYENYQLITNISLEVDEIKYENLEESLTNYISSEDIAVLDEVEDDDRYSKRIYEAAKQCEGSYLKTYMDIYGSSPKLHSAKGTFMSDNKVPVESNLLIELEDGKFHLCSASFNSLGVIATDEDIDACLENPNDTLSVKTLKNFEELTNWQELNQKYNENFSQQEAEVEAEAASEGFDYTGYKETKSRQTKNKQTQTKTQDTKALSDGYGVEL